MSTKKNYRDESPTDVVSGEWNDGLGGFYIAITSGAGIEIDLEEIRNLRPQIKQLLREHVRNPR